MFRFQGGERAETVPRKKSYLKDAQKRWSFQTHYDLSTIKKEVQLRSMIQGRASNTESQAISDVQAWMAGKQF